MTQNQIGEIDLAVFVYIADNKFRSRFCGRSST